MTTKVKAMPVVKFSTMEEFLAEISTDRDSVLHHVVRATLSWVPDRIVSASSHVFLITTARVEDYLLRYEEYLGQVWKELDGQRDPLSQETLQRAQRRLDELKERLKRLGMELRPGIWEAHQ